MKHTNNGVAPEKSIKWNREVDMALDKDSENKIFMKNSKHWPWFLVVESMSEELPLQKLFPFAVQKGFQKTLGR